MAGPALTDVVTDMLGVLAARLPAPVPTMPAPNVTLERVSERLVGLGNHRGAERHPALGLRTLRGGRLAARVRFQLWAPTAAQVDTALLNLHADLLDDRTALQQAGFLKLAAADTALAERVDVVGGWRKTTSFDVLYEYQYVDTDDADSLIARITVTTDPERAGSPDREKQTVVDEMARWDNEVAPALVVGGPATVRRIAALVFAPGPPPLGGTVTVLRSVTGSGAPVVHLPDLPTFVAEVGGSPPAQVNADVSLSPPDLFASLGSSGTTLDLGDWDVDGAVDAYAGFALDLDPAIELPTGADHLTFTYTAPPGPSTGLDRVAVVYLRVNPP